MRLKNFVLFLNICIKKHSYKQTFFHIIKTFNFYYYVHVYLNSFVCGQKPSEEIAQCMFCESKYGNEAWVPSKLQKHLEKKHNEHYKKPDSFFKQKLDNLSHQKKNLSSCCFKTS